MRCPELTVLNTDLAPFHDELAFGRELLDACRLTSFEARPHRLVGRHTLTIVAV